MKYTFQHFCFLFFGIYALISCRQTAGDTQGSQLKTTALTIKNESALEITQVKWGNTMFDKIGIGVEITKDVEYGDGYIYFTKTTENLPCRTGSLVKLQESEHKKFTFLDTTIVVDSTDIDNVTTLVQIAPRTTKLTIKNESSVMINNIKWGNTEFGALASGSITTQAVDPNNGYIFFTKTQDGLSCRTHSSITVINKQTKEFIFTDDTIAVDMDDSGNSNTLALLTSRITSLKIKNESSGDIIQVSWQGVEFMSSSQENIMIAGSTVTKTVPIGSGYIYLKLKSKPLPVRVKDITTVAMNENRVVTLTDNIIVTAIDSGTEYTLISLRNIGWQPSWTPPIGPALISSPEVDNARFVLEAVTGTVYWFRIFAEKGKSYIFGVFDYDSNGNYADVISDFYTQDGALIQSDVDNAMLTVPYTSMITQSLYIRIRIKTAGNGVVGVYYKLDE